jgi:hypothetical protein
MPSPDPLTAFLYVLMRDHAPTGSVPASIALVRELGADHVTFTAPELGQLAERYAADLRELIDPDELERAAASGVQVVPPPAEPEPTAVTDDGLQSIAALAPGQKRTAKQAVVLVFEANPGRWLKAKQIAAAIGEDRSKNALRFAIQELVADGTLNAVGATASRAYRLMAECVEGAAEGSSDKHAGSAETLPPRSPSDGADESPSGGEDDDAAAVDSSPPSLAAATPPAEPEPEDAEPWVPHRPKPKAEPRPPVNVDKVVAEIEPWVLRQQTFRKRQAVEAFAGFEPEEIRAALTALGAGGKVRCEQLGGGEPVFTVIGNEDRGSASNPGQGSTGTVEGAAMSFIQSRGSQGANIGAVATAARCSNDEAAATLSKLWREGDVRVTTNDGNRVYVAA